LQVLVTHLLFALASAAAPADASTPIAALPVVASGLGADEIDAIDRTVSRAVELHYGARAIAKKAVDERLEKAGAKGMRCDRTDPTCSAQIGAVCGAGVVVVATFVVAAGEATLAVRMVDVVEATQLAHASRVVKVDLDVNAVREVLVQLDAPAARATSLDVRGEPGARVVVDEQERGVLPLDVPLEVEPGAHDVMVMVVSVSTARAQPQPPFKKRVDVRRGEPIVVDAPWTDVPEPPPPVEPTTAPPVLVKTPTEGPPMLLIGGGFAMAAGAIAVIVGVAPLLAAHDHTRVLTTFEENARADEQFLVDNSEAIAAERAGLDEALDGWRTYGVTTVVAGAIVIAAGAAAIGVGLLE
jgi:hypothetical protein